MNLRFVLLALSLLMLAVPLVHAEDAAGDAPAISNAGAGTATAAAIAREASGATRKTPSASEAVERIRGQSIGRLPGANARADAAARTAGQKSSCDLATSSEEKAKCLASAAEEVRKSAAAAVKSRCDLVTNSEEKAECLKKASASAQNTARAKNCDAYNNSEDRARCLKGTAMTAQNAVAARNNYGQALVECKNMTTAEERVRCRLAAASAEKNPNAAIVHVPEECRLKAENSTRSACFAKYEKHLKCANDTTSEGRNRCLQRELGLNATARAPSERCANSENRTACARQLKEHALEIASARLTSLQEAARKLSDHGVSQEEIDSFVASVEIWRAALQNAVTVEEKKQAIIAVQSEWAAFKEKALEAVRAANLARKTGGVAQ